MSQYLSKEEIKQWRSSLEKITLEEYAKKLGKVLEEEKQTSDNNIYLKIKKLMNEKKVLANEISDTFQKNSADMTQEELAMKANYCHQFIRRIEAPNVKKTFSLNTVYRISKALNREFNEMFIEYPDDKDDIKKE